MSNAKIRRLDFTGSPIAESYYQDNSMHACIVGPLGSGKTHSMFARAFRHVREQPPGRDGVSRTKIICVRPTYKALRDACVPAYEQIFDPAFFGAVALTNMLHKVTFRLGGYGHPFELETIFRALDDEEQTRSIRSINATFAVINELRDGNDPSIYGQIFARCGRFPAVADGGAKFGGVISDSNCWDDEHFAHKLFVTEPAEGFKLFLQPPGLICDARGNWIENPAAEAPKHRRPGYYLNQIPTMPNEEDQRVFLRSEWGSLRGQRPVATYYRDDFHCKEAEPWPGLDFTAGIDPGLQAATIIGQAGPEGFRVFAEVVTDGAPLGEHIQLVKREFARLFPGQRLRAAYIDPAGDQRSAQTGQTTTQAARREFMPATVLPASSSNAIAERIDALQNQLRLIGKQGQPQFILHPRCTRLRKALQSGWRYKELKGSGGHFESKPYKLDAASHIADALCYWLLGNGAARGSVSGPGMDQDAFARACESRNPPGAWSPFDI